MTRITTLIIRDRHFEIVKENDYYLAIEDKYITDGKLNTTLNGLQMHADKNLQMCLNMTKDTVEVDYLVASGMSKAEAFCTYWDKMEQLAMVEEMFAK